MVKLVQCKLLCNLTLQALNIVVTGYYQIPNIFIPKQFMNISVLVSIK
jgi:hypothetical protein